LSCVTERCGFESGRDAEQVFGVVNVGHGVIAAVDGAAIVGWAKANGLALRVLELVALIPENPGPGENRVAVATQECGNRAAFSKKC